MCVLRVQGVCKVNMGSRGASKLDRRMLDHHCSRRAAQSRVHLRAPCPYTRAPQAIRGLVHSFDGVVASTELRRLLVGGVQQRILGAAAQQLQARVRRLETLPLSHHHQIPQLLTSVIVISCPDTGFAPCSNSTAASKREEAACPNANQVSESRRGR